jgi:acyltransferase
MQTQRVHFLDLFRGFAVIVMVLGHSIDAVLSADARTTELFRLYDAVRGFTAPVFLFVSGLAFTIATERRWNEYHAFGSTSVKRVGRLLLLIAIGYALHIPFFSLTKLLYEITPADRAGFVQVDVLHCLAVSLLILQGIVMLSRTPRMFAWVAAGTGAAAVLFAPVIWEVNFAPLVSPILSPYLNQQQLSIFPLFPFSAFLIAGAVTGHLFLAARAQGREHELFDWVLASSLLAAAFGLFFDVLPVQVFPHHDFWKASPNFFLIRLGIVLLLTYAFASLRRMPPLMARHMVTLGQASLLVYVVHLLTVYGSAANNGLAQVVGRSLSYVPSLAVGMVVLMAMLMLVHSWNFLRQQHLLKVRLVQLALASSLLFLFVSRPY